MNHIIKHLSLATRLLGAPVAEAALSANVMRDRRLDVNFQSLQAVLQSHGFENHLSKRRLEDIPSLSVPVVVILQNEEAAVISKVEGSGTAREYMVYQGDAPVQKISHQQLSEIYMGYCWFIKPKVTQDVRSELPEYTLPKAWFWKVIWRFKSYYTQVLISSFLINFLALVSSLYVMNVYDRVIPNKAYETLWVLSIGVILAISFEFIAKQIRAHLTDIAGKKADLVISSALFRRVMALRLIEKPVSSGSYANNLRDFESVREFMTSAGILAVVDLPFLLLFVFVISIVGGKLAFVPLTIIPLVFIVGIAIQPLLSKYINASMKEGSQRQGLAVEAIDGIETLKANNAASWAQARWEYYTASTAKSSMKVKTISSFMTNFTVAMQQLNTVFLVLLGTYLIHAENPSDRITMGAVIASVILSGRALAPLGQIAGLATRFQQARNALKGINAIVERPVERDPGRTYLALDQVHGAMGFNTVSFQYNKDSAPALNGFRLSIRPGEKVGIIGRIGSGKSTFLKVASGLLEPTSGSATLDGVDLRQLDPNFLRDQIAYFNQDARLFLGTLRENLDISRTDGYSTDQELLIALQRFNLVNLVRSHPRGLDMPLGENGQGLSGGQKQTVALARLTLRHPRVVLLDEPTASLDENTERQALQGLAEWTKDKTLIVVTHRPQVLKLVERVVVVEQGKVVMDGPRDAVIRKLQEKQS
ncbi:type I secretion system permease/ATPase [Pelistega europaea]|uniref:Cyclolysin secretion/processing ATP-binding protein CyaB n=1 Tax=Pelistega europaea TaxID=106147 RepID=A0A7Y4LBY1_9BURK|nr:type I secretion system permease/ATPase [Pelistega europaea]NOL49731.1 type I secretion system permease/ATPase [Pelistega europaea]